MKNKTVKFINILSAIILLIGTVFIFAEVQFNETLLANGMMNLSLLLSGQSTRIWLLVGIILIITLQIPIVINSDTVFSQNYEFKIAPLIWRINLIGFAWLLLVKYQLYLPSLFAMALLSKWVLTLVKKISANLSLRSHSFRLKYPTGAMLGWTIPTVLMQLNLYALDSGFQLKEGWVYIFWLIGINLVTIVLAFYWTGILGNLAIPVPIILYYGLILGGLYFSGISLNDGWAWAINGLSLVVVILVFIYMTYHYYKQKNSK